MPWVSPFLDEGQLWQARLLNGTNSIISISAVIARHRRRGIILELSAGLLHCARNDGVAAFTSGWISVSLNGRNRGAELFRDDAVR